VHTECGYGDTALELQKYWSVVRSAQILPLF